MSKLLSKQTVLNWVVKQSAWREKKSPATDKLKHYYWASIIEQNIGTILFLLVLSLTSTTLLLILAALLPGLLCWLSGKTKEWSDGNGNGYKDIKDIWFTTLPGLQRTILLLIILYLIH